MMATGAFKKYFTLDEAVNLLPEAAFDLKEAQKDLDVVRDELTLTQRLIQARQDAGQIASANELELLEKKFAALEACVYRWVQHFAAQGIILRDPASGLLDFPYYSRSRQEDYFLCWRQGEDGIFYFHSISEGFAGRHPISVLPE